MIYKNQKINDKIADNRARLRSIYSSKEGIEELFNIFHDGGMFRTITKKELDARNRAILKAQEIGLLDEELIRHMIEYLMTSGILNNIEKEKLMKAEDDSVTDRRY